MSSDNLDETIQRSRWRVVFIAAAAFSALAILFVLQRYYAGSSSGQTQKWSDLLITSFIVWWSWGLLTPLIVRIARSLPISSNRPWIAVLQLPAGLAVCVLHSLIVAAITPLFFYRPSFAPIRDMFRGRLSSALAFDIVVYSLIAAIVYLVHYARDARQREMTAARLSATLARTQLQALQAQLQPHFLFNTLNSILALIHDDPAKATVMIRRLSDLLRYCLATSNVPQVPLSDEIHFAKAYLEIQKIRFEDRLETSFDVDDRELNSLVPSFILQPLIENAVKFSLADDSRVARIAVTARRTGGRMTLTVADNGPGIRIADIERSAGMGVRTTRERLRQLYSDDHTMTFDNPSAGGTIVVVSIPDGN